MAIQRLGRGDGTRVRQAVGNVSPAFCAPLATSGPGLMTSAPKVVVDAGLLRQILVGEPPELPAEAQRTRSFLVTFPEYLVFVRATTNSRDNLPTLFKVIDSLARRGGRVGEWAGTLL